jgi:hypothetical protein
MAVTATFKHGSPVMVDYTPSSGDLTEGAVVVQGTVTGNTAGYGVIAGITHRPISNNALGALAMGGGVYSVTNLNNAATGALVYWDGTSKVTTVSTNNAQFGVIVGSGGGGANSTCLVLHDPVPAFDDA